MKLNEEEKEALLGFVTKAGLPTEDDRKEFRHILKTNQTVQRVLFMILAESDTVLGSLANQDLTTEQGVKKAIQIQARCQMFAMFVENLVEFASFEPEQKKENTNAE